MVDAVTTAVEMTKVAVVAPAGTVTLAGTPAAVGLPLDSEMAAPFAGAAPVNVTLPWALEPPTTLGGATDRLARLASGGAGPVPKSSRETVCAAEAVGRGARIVYERRDSYCLSGAEVVGQSRFDHCGNGQVLATGS